MTAVIPQTGGPAAVTRRRRRRMPASRRAFVLITLGIPFLFYAVFVLWPFAQAFIYSLTNWSGFSDTFDFVGISNYKALLNDDTFLQAVRNNLLLAIVVPFVTITLALALATMVTVGGSSTGAVRGLGR